MGSRRVVLLILSYRPASGVKTGTDKKNGGWVWEEAPPKIGTQESTSLIYRGLL